MFKLKWRNLNLVNDETTPRTLSAPLIIPIVTTDEEHYGNLDSARVVIFFANSLSFLATKPQHQQKTSLLEAAYGLVESIPFIINLK